MRENNLAYFGARPAFDTPLPVGQLYFPSPERYEIAFRGIFDRQYYTNQGPLTQQLEEQLQKFLGVEHAICVTNATIGLMIVAEALELSGKVILPSFTFAASAQSLSWTGLIPVFCDVDFTTHQISHKHICELIDDDVSAIMGVNLWGGSCNPKALSEIAASYGIQLYFDSAQAFGCAIDGTRIGNYGTAEVFSFHATKILSAGEGGCICTNDDELAEKIRNIRSSYGTGKTVKVMKTANGRMSEAQAAIALMSLEDFPKNQRNNMELYSLYEEMIGNIPGLNLIRPAGVSFSNYQYVVCVIEDSKFGINRDILIEILKAENVIARRYFYPGIHRIIPYTENSPRRLNHLTNTENICASCIQLPIGALVSDLAVERISNIIIRAHQLSEKIKSSYEKK